MATCCCLLIPPTWQLHASFHNQMLESPHILPHHQQSNWMAYQNTVVFIQHCIFGSRGFQLQFAEKQQDSLKMSAGYFWQSEVLIQREDMLLCIMCIHQPVLVWKQWCVIWQVAMLYILLSHLTDIPVLLFKQTVNNCRARGPVHCSHYLSRLFRFVS